MDISETLSLPVQYILPSPKQHPVIGPPIISPDEAAQQSQVPIGISSILTSADNTVTTISMIGDMTQIPQIKRQKNTKPGKWPSVYKMAHRRARKLLQRYAYRDRPPRTEETAFAETIEAARTSTTLHERRTRQGTISAWGSQLSVSCKQTNTQRTITPIEVDIQ